MSIICPTRRHSSVWHRRRRCVAVAGEKGHGVSVNVAALHDGDLGSFRLPSTWVLGQRNTEMCLNFVWTP